MSNNQAPKTERDQLALCNALERSAKQWLGNQWLLVSLFKATDKTYVREQPLKHIQLIAKDNHDYRSACPARCADVVIVDYSWQLSSDPKAFFDAALRLCCSQTPLLVWGAGSLRGRQQLGVTQSNWDIQQLKQYLEQQHLSCTASYFLENSLARSVFPNSLSYLLAESRWLQQLRLLQTPYQSTWLLVFKPPNTPSPPAASRKPKLTTI